MKNLKSSSRNLFSGLKDAYSDMKAGKAGDSRVNNNDDDDDNDDNDDDDDVDDDINDFAIRRHCKPVVATPDSPSGQKADKGKRPLERGSTKRRFNEEQSDAEIIDWDSDDDDETVMKNKTIKLSSPARKRHLNIKLPVKTTRKFWTAEETKRLEEGVKAYGEGNWTKILKAYNFNGRTSVHLKDRWRNLQRNK